MVLTVTYILAGVALVWISAQRLERYSLFFASKFGISPFLIGSIVIAFGTSAPEGLTSLFATLENKGTMVIGNVLGSNVANIALVFGLTLLVLSLKKEKLSCSPNILSNLIILILSTILVWIVIAINPFSLYSSLTLISSLIAVILFWYLRDEVKSENRQVSKKKFLTLKLISSLVVLILAAWLITKGALGILKNLEIGELFVGYTVLAIGTSLPEIAASLALAMKGRYETVLGTIVGSNIFNGLLVLSIPGLFNKNSLLSANWDYNNWVLLLFLLLFITILFCSYVYLTSKNIRKASFILALILLGTYFLSLDLAF